MSPSRHQLPTSPSFTCRWAEEICQKWRLENMSQRSRGNTGMTACGFFSLLKHSMLSGNCACANSVKCLPSSRVYWRKKRSLVCEQISDKSSRRSVISTSFAYSIKALLETCLGFWIWFLFAKKKKTETEESFTILF